MKPVVVANFILFNGVWFACVLGGANSLAWIGLLALLVFAIWQLGVSPHRGADVRLMLVTGAIGFFVDTCYVQVGIVHYASPAPSVETAPLWIVALWMNFALALNHSLQWLQPYPLLASVFGFIGGPLAYYGGIKLDAVHPDVPLFQALLVFALAWALVTPVLTTLAHWTRTGSFTRQSTPTE